MGTQKNFLIRDTDLEHVYLSIYPSIPLSILYLSIDLFICYLHLPTNLAI